MALVFGHMKSLAFHVETLVASVIGIAGTVGRGAAPLIAALILIAVSLSGQQSSGSISGVVQDSQGGIVPNVKVTLLNQAQGTVARELQTSGEGTFFFTPVPPGTYTVSVETAGFKKYVRTDIILYAQDRVGLPPIVLELGAVGETVNVESSTVSLQTVSAERSGVLTGSQMVDLGFRKIFAAQYLQQRLQHCNRTLPPVVDSAGLV